MEWQIGNLPAALRSVPRNQGYWTGEGEDHERIPVGQYCHEAADALDAKDDKIEGLQELLYDTPAVKVTKLSKRIMESLQANSTELREALKQVAQILKDSESHATEEAMAEVQRLITKILGK